MTHVSVYKCHLNHNLKPKIFNQNLDTNKMYYGAFHLIRHSAFCILTYLLSSEYFIYTL